MSIVLIFSLMINTNIFADTDGKKLFVKKCASCHMLKFPEKRSLLKASPVGGMMYQLNQNISSDEKIVSFIQDFVMNPSEDKIVFNRIRKFGAMPSQKGKLTEEELKTIAEWMVEDIFMTRKEYKNAKLRMKRSSSN